VNIARVFPRRTNATPTDEYSFSGEFKKTGEWMPPLPHMFMPPIDEVRISVAFTYDLKRAEWLIKQWEHVAPVKIGGPAMDDPGGEFIPGMYIKPGYLVTSRGCPNNCWFCDVPRREGRVIRTQPIYEGNDILDSNILACPKDHIMNVFEMLKNQKHGPVKFTGGLEAARLKDWHVEELRKVNPKEMYFAYDTPDDYEPLMEAGEKLLNGGFTVASHALKAYVLIGWPKDTFEAAEKRLSDTIKAGFMPMAMLYRDKKGNTSKQWERYQREWANPYIVGSKMKAVKGGNQSA
jgi:hypothetical protein